MKGRDLRMRAVVIMTRSWLTDSFLEMLGPTSPPVLGSHLSSSAWLPHLQPMVLTPPAAGRHEVPAATGQRKQSDRQEPTEEGNWGLEKVRAGGGGAGRQPSEGVENESQKE